MSTSLFVVLSFICYLHAAHVTISNILPRRSTDGLIMDIHDGTLLLHEHLYYYFGASYGLCKEPPGETGCAGMAIGSCGFQLNHNVSLYTSTDLVSWHFKGHPFEIARDTKLDATMFCPKVLYNARTKLWVLYWNWIDKNRGFADSYYGVATSATPEGPFQVVSNNITTLRYANTGDFNLFQDDNGDAYIIYTSHITGSGATHLMSIEKLTPDYLSTMGEKASSGYFGDGFVEAPAMFKRNGKYYAVFGKCCCYCKSGGPVRYYTADAALGPYTSHEVITAKIPAQQTHIFAYKSPQGIQYMWQGDRWQSAPDQLKGHDFTYWQPLHFDTAGNIAPLSFQESFEIDVDN
jgi:hypothetical protein